MEEAAYVEPLSLDAAIARYWKDREQAERDLINALKKHYPTGGERHPSTLAYDSEQRYRELLLASCDIIDLANLPETDRHVATRQIELRRLYVPLRVRVEVTSDVAARAAHIEAIEKRQRSLRGPFSNLSGGTAEDVDDDPASRVSIGHRLAAAKRIVVLGDAGSGKTTLTRWIATAYLLSLRDDADLRNLPDVATLPYNDWLPVIVRCRDLDEPSLTGSLDNLLRYTLTKAELREAEVEALRSSIIERMTQGQAILLLDGLDEITDASLRSKFCQQLEKIQIAYPNAPLIVTSRTVGYREMGDPLGRGFEHVTVAELTREDKDNFARRWCLLTERPERQSEAAAELIHDIHSTDRIERLTRNPMLLTTMALVKRKVGRLPSRRADLYWDALEVLLNWRREVDQPIDHREALPQLEYVAFGMCERGVQQIRQDDLLILLHRMRDEYPQIHSLQRHTPEEFLTILERRTGIIVEAGHIRHLGRPVAIYEFRHLTFQEYLAGLALVDGRFPGRDRLKALAENVSPLAGRVTESNPEQMTESGTSENWTEALRLCVTVCNDDDVDDVLLAILNPADENDQSHRSRAILATLCLADEPNVSHSVAIDILERLVLQITTADGRGPIKTGIDVAIRELTTSAWAPEISKMLIRKWVTEPEPPRTAFGSLYAAIAAASAPTADPDLGVWLQNITNTLADADEIKSAGSALTIVDLAYRNRVALVSNMIPKLIGMLNMSVANAHAASWALRWLNARATKNRWQPTSELPQLIDFVKRPATDVQVTRNLILILGEERARGAVPVLLEKLNSHDKDIEKAAISALGRIGDPEAAPYLVVKLEDGDATVRSATVRALGSLGRPDTFKPLLNRLGDEEETVRAHAVEAIAEFQNGEVTSALVGALGDRSELVRFVAASGLGNRREPFSVEPLILSLNDESPLVQNEAAEALGKIGNPKAETHLLAKTRDENPTVRAAAMRALGQMGSAHLEAIVTGLKDEASDVRGAAEFTLLSMALQKFETDKPAAIDIFSRMVALIPNQDYRNDLAYCLILAGRYPEAAEHYDLIDLSFSFSAALYRHNRGILFFLMGERDRGVHHLQESLSMIALSTDYDPREVVCMLVLDARGQVHSEKGIPLDAGAVINLCMMGALSQEETVTQLLTRYPNEGEQWIHLLRA